MNRPINLCKVVNDFLDKHYSGKAPLLVALSGGVDSLALYRALVRLAVRRPLSLHIAHVDHGWREESREEGAQLQKMVAAAGLSFHLCTLPPPIATGNLEAVAREGRYAFFREVSRAIGAEATLLAHHADDQAESVLKRLLEGASLTRLSGILPAVTIEGLTLWRPLLTVAKGALALWLAREGLTPFDDATNYDERFLRARLRQRILPELEGHFGKNVRNNLCRLASSAAELREFVDQITAPYLARLVVTAGSWALDFSADCPPPLFLLKAVVKAVGERAGVVITHELLDKLAAWILHGDKNKACTLSGKMLYVHQRRLSVVAEG